MGAASRIVLLVIVVLLGCAASALAEAPPAPPYRVIVHPRNATRSLSRRFVGDALLKKTTRWPDGRVIRPVDLPLDSPVRRRFSDEVLNRSVEAVRAYWQHVVFSGRDVPPPQLASDAEVVKYVATHEGAVGYVSGIAPVEGARVVGVE